MKFLPVCVEHRGPLHARRNSFLHRQSRNRLTDGLAATLFDSVTLELFMRLRDWHCTFPDSAANVPDSLPQGPFPRRAFGFDHLRKWERTQ